MCKSVIGVTGAFNHSNMLIHKDLQACDWVIGKKANFWGIEIDGLVLVRLRSAKTN